MNDPKRVPNQSETSGSGHADIVESKFRPDIRRYFEVLNDNRPPHIGPETFAISFSELPKDSRVATIKYWFGVGSSARIWPEGDESRAVEMIGPRGKVEVPVPLSRRRMIYLPPTVNLGTKLIDAR